GTRRGAWRRRDPAAAPGPGGRGRRLGGGRAWGIVETVATLQTMSKSSSQIPNSEWVQDLRDQGFVGPESGIRDLRSDCFTSPQRSIRESWMESSGACSMKCQETSLATTFTNVMRNFALLEPESIGIGPRSGNAGSA